MAGRKSKPASKGKSRSKKLSVKKQPIKDLDPTGKDVKGGVKPIGGDPIRVIGGIGPVK
jgi:hypothetical protein